MLKDSGKYVSLPYCVSCGSFVREYKVSVQVWETQSCHVSIDTYDVQAKDGTLKKVFSLENEVDSSNTYESEELEEHRCMLCNNTLVLLAVEPDLAQKIVDRMEQTNNFFHAKFAECPDELGWESTEAVGVKQAKQLRKEILKALL